MISLVLMLGLVVAAILVWVYEEPIAPLSGGESIGVVVESFANIIATLVVIGVVSVCSTILAGIGLLRRESPMPAAIALCLAVPALVVTILAIIRP